VVIDSKFSTVVCAPIYTRRDGLSTQVSIGPDEGLRHPSSIHCDALISLPKSSLTDFVGTLPDRSLRELGSALRIALELE
jgi:mRNA interferase MazF